MVGTTPAKILIDESIKTLSYSDPQSPNKWIQNVRTEYTANISGGCNWYANGRFWEVYGIPFPRFRDFFTSDTYLDSADKYDEFNAIRDKYDVRDNSIVVYGKGQDIVGHVAFVEYVERDARGKPLTIYFTEANAGDSVNNRYVHGIDGVIKTLSFCSFVNRAKPVIGYIIPNPDFYK